MRLHLNKLQIFVSGFILIIVLSGCHNYYSASTPNQSNSIAKPTFGIKTGLSLSNATIKQTDTDPRTLKTSARTGVLGGIYLDVPLAKELIFRPEGTIVSKGARQKDSNPYYYGYSIRFTYIDFPLNILYKKDYSQGHLIVGGGPVIGIPISDSYSGYPLKTDFGINGLIGYEFSIGFSFNLNYTYGLTNASNDNSYISKITNRYLGITVGYSF
ncbi:MAG TPA: outer membrane beta-barrel protein [Ginsengibacter sp.]|nr:outer membrane beta-barrel protein [Ginsengibacter sp.]